MFDILWLDGESTTALPLEERRALLKKLPFTAPLRRVDLLDDPEPWERARREGWEGVIAKRRGSPYEHRRSKQWLKMKCEASQELVVGGFTDPQGARVGLGALLVGYYDGDDLVFAGKIGTGFDTKLLLDLRARLDALEIPKTPFTIATGLPKLRAHWVTPSIVVQVSFIEWTRQQQAAPSASDRRALRQGRARSGREEVVITHPEKGDVSGRWDHQGRPRRVLRNDRAGDPAAHQGPSDHDGALPGRHRQERLLAEGRLEGISRVARARRGPEERRRRASSGDHRSSDRCCG